MQERIWTASTIFSLSRVFLTVPIAYCLISDFPGNRWWTVGLILLAVATDLIDGYLARRLHQVTEFGKIIDPLADKFAVGIVAIILWWVGELPLWFLLVVLARDILIFAGGMYIRKTKNIVVQSNLPGKIAVNAVGLVILLTILQIPALETFRLVMIWLSLASMVFSFANYTQRLFIGRNVAKAPIDGSP